MPHRPPGDVNRAAHSATGASGGPDNRLLAMLLDQLAVEPGHRIREVGPGHLADQLAVLAGQTGTVVYGTGGWRADALAPYDRIVVTRPRWDLAPAWTRQLSDHGRLVVALRLRGGTHCVVFTGWRCLYSVTIRLCTPTPHNQLPHRGERRQVLDIPGERPVLTWDQDQTINPSRLGRHLGHPPGVSLWTGVTIEDGEELGQLWLWLAAREPGACGLAGGTGTWLAPLANPDGTPTLVEETTFAYLTRREPPPGCPGNPRRFEIGIAAYGPYADTLSARFANHVSLWRAAGNKHVGIAAYPLDGSPPLSYPPHISVIDRYRTRFVVG
ncbi:hypothetical protein BS329_38725 [Amycolatopsis coloradensis]|uniref:Uncharacterized protein n=1 Tax=Amycolatopsis coloradensis TaxID=76021 RepID=A0A1R0KEL8_9PSEU|nr:hypothetical protein [Amycolatopsis coloradensis]OLZ43594.1 hypothetical protein BS329_38725 [Amycolatopsis coloradensis]